MEDRIFYVNYLWDITPQPEYFPYSDGPLVSNLGFLASTDPVALDGATFDLIRQEGACIENSVARDFPKLLDEAEASGLGSSDWTIKRLS